MSDDTNRDPESVLLEADYWRAMLSDVREINSGVLEGATAVADIPLMLLRLLIASDPKQANAEAIEATRTALSAIESMQAPIDRLISLATGRLIVLRHEAGLPPIDETTL